MESNAIIVYLLSYKYHVLRPSLNAPRFKQVVSGNLQTVNNRSNRFSKVENL